MIAFKEHASSQFDADLSDLVAQMAAVKTQLHRFIALISLSVEDGVDRTQEAKVIDKSVNELEFSIDQQVMRLISKFAPMMDELRMVLAIVKIAGLCESAADKLKNTVKRVGKLNGLKGTPEREVFLTILDKTADQFDIVLDRFSQIDEATMKQVLEEREVIHGLYQRAIAGLQPSDNAIGISFALRNVERVSELAYDIAKIGYAARHNRKFAKPEFLQ